MTGVQTCALPISKVDTIHAVVCFPESYEFAGKHYYSTGCYSDTSKTAYNCDSITVLDLIVADGYNEIIYDTICSTDTYVFNGEPITKSGKYIEELKTIYDCDSITTLNIVVYETLLIDIDTVVNICEDDENIIIPYIITSGRLGDYGFILDGGDSIEGVSIQNNSFVIPLPQGLKPNRYKGEISFGKQSCGKEKETIFIDLLYSRDVIAQRWNDVLAVKNSEYNGGYDFVAYQWYKNSDIIVGATSSVLYVEEQFNSNDEYSVLLTRADDGVSQMVCAIVPEDLSSAVGSEQVVLSLNNGSDLVVNVPQKSYVRLWSVMGVLVGTFDFEEGNNYISTTGMHGFYILEINLESGERFIEKINIQ